MTKTNLILIDKDDLKDAIREIIREVNPTNTDDEILTSHGLAAYLGYSYDWVLQSASKVKRGKDIDFPPIHRRGRKLLFRKSEVDSWLEGRQS